MKTKCPIIYMGACVIYTGPDIPHLEIQSGVSSIDEVLQALILSNGRPGSEVISNTLSSSDIKADSRLFDVGSNKSICGAQLEELNYTFSIIPGEERTRFEYDLRNIQDSLPKGFKIVSKSVQGISMDSGTTIASAGGISGGFEIANTRVPVTVLLRYNLNSPCGRLEIRGAVSILGNDPGGTYKGKMSVANEIKPPSDSTQQEINEMLAAELSLVKREVFYSISQPLDVRTSIEELRKTILKLELKVKELESR